MKFNYLAMSAVLLLVQILVAASAVADDEKEIDPKFFEVVSVERSAVGPSVASSGLDSQGKGTIGEDPGSSGKGIVQPKIQDDSPTEGLVLIDKIISVGTKIWDLVVRNKPVVENQADIGNALPVGVTNWSEMSEWNAPKAQSYRVVLKNIYGIEVVDYTYRVTFTSGGSYQGKGKYLSRVTVVPAEIKVLWGFKLNSTANIVNVTNSGTTENPVAAIELAARWEVSTPISHLEQTDNFYVRGDGAFTEYRK